MIPLTPISSPESLPFELCPTTLPPTSLTPLPTSPSSRMPPQVFKSDTTVYIADDSKGINKLTTTNAVTLAGPWVSAYTILPGGKGARYLTGRVEGSVFVLYCAVPPSGSAVNTLYRYDTSTETAR